MYEEFEKENAHDTYTSSVLPQSIRKRCQANCKSVSPSRVKRNNIRYQCIKKNLPPSWHGTCSRSGRKCRPLQMILKRTIRAYGDHEPNICIEIGAPAIRRRAEGSLYVLETAFTVQRALCTFEGKPLSLRNVQTLAPIGLNSKYEKTRPKGQEPRAAGFGPCAPKLGPNIRIESE